MELANEGASELGFTDLGAMWRSGYDMPPDDFTKEAARLWGQVKPLYDSLHCYVRGRLQKTYGAERVPDGKPIPAWQLFWPLFGTDFPVVPVSNYWLEVLLRPFSHPVELIKELIGLGSLLYLAVAFGMFEKESLKRFLRNGQLPAARVTIDQNRPG